MSKVSFIFISLTCVCAVFLIPSDLFAQTTDFGGQEFLNQSKKIQDFLFGPAMRIAGVLGGAYGLIQAIVTSAVRPLLVYGGIGMGVSLIPKFIDGVFISGMLLP